MQQVTDEILHRQLELQNQQQRFMHQIMDQMMGQRVVHTELLVLNIEPHDGVDKRSHENGEAQEDITSAARSRFSVTGSQSQSSIKVSWLST